ncbi:extracellular solute-binding protein [Paenibacillus hemerocallicola]|uniref:Extracellular solute-binding protein n=2 Tax=Paenibacillus hemerocallicola TaxID=1172614 RepID=A0A5C4T1D0_9BACL|nr:extracellular solute-binding protein [Paenibacillus hemerocallicola]
MLHPKTRTYGGFPAPAMLMTNHHISVSRGGSKMKKRWVALMLGTAIAVTAGCGGAATGTKEEAGSANGDKKGTAEPAAGLDKIDKPVTLVVFDTTGNWTKDNFAEAFSGSNIMQKFPNVTLKFMPFHKTRGGLTTDEMIAAGEQIDLIVGSPGTVGAGMYNQKLEADIAPLVKTLGFDLSRLNPGAVSIVKEVGNGTLHGIPFAMSHTAMMYNKDIFDKFGVAYPKDGMTWDDTYELAKKLTRTDGGKAYYGMFVSFYHAALRNQSSLNLFDPNSGKSAFDSAAWKSFYGNFSRFYDLYDLNATQVVAAQQKKMWDEEQVVAMYMPGSGDPAVKGLKNYDYVQSPVFKEKPGVGPQAYPFTMYISQTSKHKEEALKVINYLVSDEYQKAKAEEGTFIPALKDNKYLDVFGKSNPSYQGKNVKALLPAVHADSSKWNAFTGTYAKEALNAFIDIAIKTKDANTALREGVERADKAVQTSTFK